MAEWNLRDVEELKVWVPLGVLIAHCTKVVQAESQQDNGYEETQVNVVLGALAECVCIKM